MTIKSPAILFVIFFFWLFPPVLTIFGTLVKTNYFFVFLLGALFLGCFFRNFRETYLLQDMVYLLLFGFAYVLFFSLLSALVFSRLDYAFLKDYIAGFFVLLSAGLIVFSYQSIYRQKMVEKIVFHLFVIGVIHSLILLLVIFFESFRDFLYSVVWVTDKQNRYLFGDVMNLRVSGLLASGFSSLSTTHALMFCLGFIYVSLIGKKLSLVRLVFYSIFLLIIFSSLIFTGRTGILLLLTFVVLFFLFAFTPKLIAGKSSKVWIKLLGVLMTLIVVSLSFFDFEKISNEIDSSFEIFINLAEGEGFSTTSTDVIKNEMLIFPETGHGLIFGELNFGRGEERIYSDLGFVYMVSGVGLIGLLIMWSFYIPIIFGAFNILKQRNLAPVSFFVMFMVLISIPLNFKDLYFLSLTGFTKILFVFVFVMHVLIVKRRRSQVLSATTSSLN